MTIAQHLIGLGMNGSLAATVVGGISSGEAGAGTTQADATLLSMSSIHWVKTGASNSGVILPPGNSTTATTVLGPGDSIWVFANTGNTLKVYPPGTGTINGGSASASVSLTDKQKGLFVCLDGGANANFIALVS